MKKVLVQFIPIILIFLLLTYTEKMVQISNTSLGKIVIIMIILFYATIDKLYGILVCLLFILFYQSDTRENMLNNNIEKKSIDIESFEPNIDTTLTNTAIKPLESISYLDQYELPKITSQTIKNEFRQQYCEKGHLVNKGQKIKIDMAEHIHPEISFNDNKCNICDSKCDFNIIEKQIDIVERIRPKCAR